MRVTWDTSLGRFSLGVADEGSAPKQHPYFPPTPDLKSLGKQAGRYYYGGPERAGRL